jgi:hypothetical protein
MPTSTLWVLLDAYAANFKSTESAQARSGLSREFFDILSTLSQSCWEEVVNLLVETITDSETGDGRRLTTLQTLSDVLEARKLRSNLEAMVRLSLFINLQRHFSL